MIQGQLIVAFVCHVTSTNSEIVIGHRKKKTKDVAGMSDILFNCELMNYHSAKGQWITCKRIFSLP